MAIDCCRPVPGARAPSPQSNGLFGVHVFDENNAIAVGQTATVLITSDGGTQWEVLSYVANVEADLYGVCFVNDNEGWAVIDFPNER